MSSMNSLKVSFNEELKEKHGVVVGASNLWYPLMRNWKLCVQLVKIVKTLLVSFNEELKVYTYSSAPTVITVVSFNEELKGKGFDDFAFNIGVGIL